MFRMLGRTRARARVLLLVTIEVVGFVCATGRAAGPAGVLNRVRLQCRR